MTRIECERCNEIVELTGHSVALPFYCDDCDNADVLFCQESQDVQEYLVEPEPTPLLDILRAEQGEGTWKGVGGETIIFMTPVPDKDHEDHEGHDHTATVENTTLLIEDLEAQVEALVTNLELANTLIGDMSSRLEAADESLALKQANLEYWREAWRKFYHRYFALKHRGFWARVFNKESD